ncbi:MAG: hypothetical protein Q8M76_18855 [Spirochaetaceae bacterium]|nr:hypothetical protein [Spirochaetaceae bacterium]
MMLRSCFRCRVLVAVLALLAAGPACSFGQGSGWRGGGGPYLGLDVYVGTPSAASDAFRAAFPGASLRYIATKRLEFSLDYAFMDVEYYYPESGDGPWKGPVQWSSMPSAFEDMRGDWIFYHTKHFLAPQAWYVAPLDEYGAPLSIRLGAGPAISLIVPNEAAKFYPGLSDAFAQFKESFQAYLGLSLRLGVEYKPWRFARLGVEYLFLVDSLADFAGDIGANGMDFFKRSGNFIVYAGVRL